MLSHAQGSAPFLSDQDLELLQDELPVLAALSAPQGACHHVLGSWLPFEVGFHVLETWNDAPHGLEGALVSLCDAPDQDHAAKEGHDGALVRVRAHVPLLAHVLKGYAVAAVAPGQAWALRAQHGQEQEHHKALLRMPDQVLQLWLLPCLPLGLW